MKKITYLILAIVIQLTTSCSKDFLVKTPNDAIDPSKVDATKIQELRNGLYDYLPSGGSEIYNSAYVDDSFNQFPWESNAVLIQQNAITAATDEGYDATYEGIRICNVFLYYLNNLDGITDEQKITYSAEARMARAWMYLNATLTFGDLVIVTDPNETYEGGVERTDKVEVRKWILDEIDFAKANLPEAGSNDDGKFNKNVAYAISARAAYYFGDYKRAEKDSKWVIDNSGKTLFTREITKAEQKDADFIKTLITDPSIDKDKFVQGVFNYLSVWNADYNSEIIFSKEYDVSSIADYGSILPTQLLSPNLTAYQGYGSVVPIQNLVNSYFDAKGNVFTGVSDVKTRAHDYKALRDEIQKIQDEQGLDYSAAVASIASDLPSKPFYKEFLNRDPRLYATIIFPFTSVDAIKEGAYQEYNSTIANFGKSGYNYRKFSSGTDFKIGQDGGYEYCGSDFAIVRLSEMLLTYAEAHTQTTGYDNLAVAELNKIRERCGMPEVNSSLSKNDALDFIRHERRIELAAEGFRIYDVRLYQDDTRNGGYKGKEAAENVMKGTTYDIQGNKRIVMEWNDRLMYMPIPDVARDKNPKLDQNPGY